MKEHYRYSSYRETLIEHLFVGELLRHLWIHGIYSVEVMKPNVDAAGYDLAIQCGPILRHIQLKASASTSRTERQNIHTLLTEKPSGCVVWIRFEPETLNLNEFLFLGAPPGNRLPDLEVFPAARHTRGNAQGYKAERSQIRKVPRLAFQRLQTIEEVAAQLFGRTPSARAPVD